MKAEINKLRFSENLFSGYCPSKRVSELMQNVGRWPENFVLRTKKNPKGWPKHDVSNITRRNKGRTRKWRSFFSSILKFWSLSPENSEFNPTFFDNPRKAFVSCSSSESDFKKFSISYIQNIVQTIKNWQRKLIKNKVKRATLCPHVSSPIPDWSAVFMLFIQIVSNDIECQLTEFIGIHFISICISK